LLVSGETLLLVLKSFLGENSQIKFPPNLFLKGIFEFYYK